MKLQAKNVRKTFGNFTALHDINLGLESGELTALLGPSGCGKTTLLRLFAGLETPDDGEILIDGTDQSGIDVRHRNVGFVFQHYALFRHMSVFENVAFGLRVKKAAERPSRADIAQRVHEVLGLVQLDNQSKKFPDQLSGGQRQRVALARSLVTNPKILLLDEPFGALDANVRRDLRRWLRRLHDEIHVTTILVTHDQEEALEVADRIVLLNKGRIEQSGSPEDIYLRPANPFVYEFLGSVNVFHERIRDGRFVPTPPEVQGGKGPATSGLAAAAPLSAESPAGTRTDTATAAYVRPYDLTVSRTPPATATLADSSDGNTQTRVSSIRGTVVRVAFAGALVRIEVRESAEAGHTASASEDGIIEAAVELETFRADPLKAGETVWLTPRRYTTFMGEGI